MSLRGMGVFNYETDKLSGENYFLRKLAKTWNKPVIIDVGANVGDYATEVKQIISDATLFAFEPHPRTFDQLKTIAAKYDFEAINAACGRSSGKLALYDYADAPGSQHATFHSGAMELHQSSDNVASWQVNVTTIDEFALSRSLQKIDLLKIDTEGHELPVLQGATSCIAQGKISAIHFEFNEMNVASRVFFQDFRTLLKDFRLYRLLPDGLVPMEPYSTIKCELFAYQNIAAFRIDMADELEKAVNG
ncbi:MAG TPA: FkbM family methyltransferase [Tepidisphaeraceae bacterium]|nr:FkbM family methyltransferase [Tepidisphaeraceae bacterium]